MPSCTCSSARAADLAQQLNLDPTGLGSAEEQYGLLVQQAREARARGAYPEAERILEQAIEIQSGFAKRAYDGYMHQMSKIGGMYAELAKEAYKPVEKAMQGAR